MPAETNLEKLSRNLQPVLLPGDYVFVTLPGMLEEYSHLEPLGIFQEPEGLSLILPRERAQTVGLVWEGLFRQITLRVHSSLEAVGLTAAVSTALARQGISANVVAAYHHDHIFVPAARAQEALQVLEGLAGQ